MKVSDEDLMYMPDLARQCGPRAEERVELVRAELLALRAVADCARELIVDWANEDDDGIATRLDVIELRLKAAGR